MDHLVDLDTSGGRRRARCSCGWAGRARLEVSAAEADAQAHIERVGSGRLLGQSRQGRIARRLHAEGRCSNCGEPLEGEGWRCQACRELRGDQERLKGEELVAAGICRKCRRRPAERNRTRCAECLEKARLVQQRSRERKRMRAAGGTTRSTASQTVGQSAIPRATAPPRNGETADTPPPPPAPEGTPAAPFTCRRCGGLSLPPRRTSLRPPDVCTSCWPREPENRERRNAQQLARHHARYASEPEYREKHKTSSRERGRRRRAERNQAAPLPACRLCGEPSRPPRRDSLRPPDVCTPCWPSTPECRESRSGRKRARYASDPEYREQVKARSRERGRRQLATPEQRERKNAYLRQYMRERRRREREEPEDLRLHEPPPRLGSEL